MKLSPIITAMALLAAVTSSASAQSTAPRGTSKLSHEQLRIAAQEICPVSGRKLGDHGTPIKVAVGQQKEEVYLCCKGCLSGKLDAKHWSKIHRNIAAAQGKCPVMQKPLPDNAKWTVVKGQVVYVCCPPCTNKIEKTPDTYLSKVDEYYSKSLQK